MQNPPAKAITNAEREQRAPTLSQKCCLLILDHGVWCWSISYVSPFLFRFITLGSYLPVLASFPNLFPLICLGSAQLNPQAPTCRPAFPPTRPFPSCFSCPTNPRPGNGLSSLGALSFAKHLGRLQEARCPHPHHCHLCLAPVRLLVALVSPLAQP
jgi:hypothetical protein